MGYEVLDAGDSGPTTSARSARPKGTGLGAAPQPDSDLVGRAERPGQDGRPSPRPDAIPIDPIVLGPSTDAVASGTDGPRRPSGAPWTHGRRRVVLLTIGALVVGGIAGSAWAERHDRQVRAAERRGTVAVTAVSSSYTQHPSTHGQAVDVVVRLFNTGPMPLEVVESFDDSAMTVDRPLVHSLGGDVRLTTETPLAVSVTQALDCSSTKPLQLSVPVRTADGEQHQVPVQRGAADELVPHDLCLEQDPGLSLGARLTGTLQQPVLVLVNPLDQRATVYLDPGSPLTQTASQIVSLSTRPRLPAVVAPHSERRLAISVDAPSCTRDLARVQESGAFGGVGLVAQTDAPTSDGSTRTPLYLDLTALVGAALQRACR